MNNSNSEIDELHAELIATRDEIYREMGRLSPHWEMKVGPFPIYVVSPKAISLLYGAFLAVCFALGIWFTLLNGTLASLGVALIVGTLFAGGAVVAQIWSFSIQGELNLFEQAFGDERTSDLKNLASASRTADTQSSTPESRPATTRSLTVLPAATRRWECCKACGTRRWREIPRSALRRSAVGWQLRRRT